jgi:hypothetical protein
MFTGMLKLNEYSTKRIAVEGKLQYQGYVLFIRLFPGCELCLFMFL